MGRSNKSGNVINEIKVKKTKQRINESKTVFSETMNKTPRNSEYCKGLLQKPLLHLVGKPK